MSHLFLNVGSWHWFGLAAILVMVEVITGTGFLLCLGASAFSIGVLLVFYPLDVTMQLFMFATFSIVAALSWKLYLHFHPKKENDLRLNQRAAQYIGRELTLKTSIVNGYGTVCVDDTIWRVRCDSKLTSGASVRIIGTDGVILIAQQLK
jgi:inner membrane protein